MSSNDYEFSRDIPYRPSRLNPGSAIPERVAAQLSNRFGVTSDEATDGGYGMPPERWKQGGPERQLPSETSAEQIVRRSLPHPADHA